MPYQVSWQSAQRMIIRIAGYTEDEKVEIARKQLSVRSTAWAGQPFPTSLQTSLKVAAVPEPSLRCACSPLNRKVNQHIAPLGVVGSLQPRGYNPPHGPRRLRLDLSWPTCVSWVCRPVCEILSRRQHQSFPSVAARVPKALPPALARLDSLRRRLGTIGRKVP
jgi:hypothetical protein